MKRALLALSFAVVFGFVAGVNAETHPTVSGEFGNHCAWGLTKGQQVMTDCKITWQDQATKKTYCFANEANKAEFAKDTKGNTEKAESEYNHLVQGAHKTSPHA